MISNTVRLKKILSRVGLYLGLILYTIVGAKIFQELESPQELYNHQTFSKLLLQKREMFLHVVGNYSGDFQDFREHISSQLSAYEHVAGINQDQRNWSASWDLTQSVFFTTTILTTIGYGNISPVTQQGRLFCIFFAIIGIPFTLSVLTDLGQILATIISKVWKQYTQKIKPLLEKYKIIEKAAWDKEEDIGLASNIATAVGSLLVLIGFLSIGAFFFSFNEDITFFDAFYFCFITMTTIGFGDIVPSLDKDGGTCYMVLSTVYILVGMTVFTTIIEIVRRQYLESWKKMQQMKSQIQAQIRLADSLALLRAQGGNY